MPSKKPAPRVAVTRPPRWERERKRQRLILLFGIIAIALVVGVVGYGYTYFRVFPRWETAIKVNDATISTAYLAKMLRLTVLSSPTDADPLMLINSAVAQIQQQELIRQGGGRLNISVTPEEMEQSLRERVLPAEGGNEADFPRLYAGLLERTGLTDQEYRRLTEVSLLHRKIREHLGAQIPEEQEQVHLYGILVEKEEPATEIRQRLETGEDFAELARELSQDTGSKERDGDMGWMPRGIRTDLEGVAFSLEPGEISQPVPGQGGYYLLKVAEKATRALEDEDKARLQEKAWGEWLAEQRQSSQIETFIDDRRLSWALSQVR